MRQLRLSDEYVSMSRADRSLHLAYRNGPPCVYRDGDDEVIDDDIKILQQYARHEQSRNEARSVEDPAATTASGKRGRSRSPRFARVERRTMTGKPGAEAFGRDRTVLERYTSALGHEDAPSPVGENAAQDDLPRKLSSESQGKGHHGVSDFYVGEKVCILSPCPTHRPSTLAPGVARIWYRGLI